MKDLPRKLPVSFYFFFWDIDAKKLDPSKRPYYVINRLLDKGNLEAVRWVRKNFPEELIIETIKKMRDFSPKTVIFWSRLLNIPIEEIKCMQEPYRSMRKMHWPN
ncbi:hypothetical protein A2W14_01400 [Candidatus Gottesmanbacteria bacterium RBG_16_37_8]|uniref:DUF6922 domain-containing protein n=1 Tax=Candidatus Gottesmanbacteria bacterium RBG_16_37_8 TaxID=1798371 RepID=A0A1F5YUP9_9BACT|nr:MAG: hypothetical protein A2W14_01400 [Candidatus Gottesmanbacteria bacterium RBG_16_37_8]